VAPSIRPLLQETRRTNERTKDTERIKITNRQTENKHTKRPRERKKNERKKQTSTRERKISARDKLAVMPFKMKNLYLIVRLRLRMII
jgi:hypothetical protein